MTSPRFTQGQARKQHRPLESEVLLATIDLLFTFFSEISKKESEKKRFQQNMNTHLFYSTSRLKRISINCASNQGFEKAIVDIKQTFVQPWKPLHLKKIYTMTT